MYCGFCCTIIKNKCHFGEIFRTYVHRTSACRNFSEMIHMKTSLLSFCFVLLSTLLHAQQTGKVDYPNLGISFTIPDGWVGQETDGGFMIGHYTIPGLILLSPHEVRNLEDMKREAAMGMSDGMTIDLRLSAEISALGNNAISADYTGTIQGQPARAFAIGIINPQGSGVNIVAMSSTTEFSQALKDAAMSVYRSLNLKKADTGDLVRQWKEGLANTRLTYMESYTSSPSYDGGMGGGYSSQTVIDLCGEGYFNFSSQGSISVGGDGVSGSSSGSNRGNGTWAIEAQTGEAVLVLRFHSGEVRSYSLDYRDDKLFLNGNRFFRTTSGDHAPACY